ncbi:MAG: hypothetical protein ACQETB_06895 [Halobacteriota archaeon]
MSEAKTPADRIEQVVVVTVAIVASVLAVAAASLWTATATIGVGAGLAIGWASAIAARWSSPVLSALLSAVCVTAILAPTAAIVAGSIHLAPLDASVTGYIIGTIGIWGMIVGVSTLGFGLGAIVALGMAMVLTTALAGWVVGHPVTLLGFVLGGVLTATLVYGGSIIGRQTFSSGEGASSGDPLVVSVEFATVAVVASTVPFGARAIGLFPLGGIGPFLVGVGLTAAGARSIGRLRARVDADRLSWYTERLVESALRTAAEIKATVQRVTGWTGETHTEPADRVEDASSIVAAAPVRVPAAHQFLADAQSSLVGGDPNRATAAAAVATALAERVPPTDAYIDGASRFLEALVTDPGSMGVSTADLSDARDSHEAGSEDEARTIAENAVAAAIGESKGLFELVVQQIESARERRGSGSVAEALARLEAALAMTSAHALAGEVDTDDATETIQDLIARLTDDQSPPPIDSPRQAVRAAAGTGWDAVCRGDEAIEADDYTTAAGAYTIAIEAYLLALQAAVAGGFDTDAGRIRTTISILLDEQADVLFAIARDAYPTPGSGFERRDRAAVEADRRHSGETAADRSALSNGLSTIKTATKRTGIRSEGVRSVRLFVRHGELDRRLAGIRADLDTAATRAAAGDLHDAAETYEAAAAQIDALGDRAADAGLRAAADELSTAGVRCRRTAEQLRSGATDGMGECTLDLPYPAVPQDLSVEPIGDRLREALADERLVTLRSLLVDARTHRIAAAYDEPTSGKVSSMAAVVATMDPLFGTPNLDGLEAVGRDVTRSAFESALERLETDLAIVHGGPVPPGFATRPAILDADPIGDLDAARSLSAYAATWRDRAAELADAIDTLSAAIDATKAYLAHADAIESTLRTDGVVSDDDVATADPIAVFRLAACRIDAARYDAESETLVSTTPTETATDARNET